MGICLGYCIDNANEADQDYKTCGKKVHDELKRIFHLKSPNQGFDSEKKKKNRKETNDDNFAPP